MNLQEKIAANTWDHIDDVLPVLEKARSGEWSWCSNSECKYIELRIDMRDGGCIIKNREGVRIEPADLRKQVFDAGGLSWADMQALREGK